jgi:opacity protein-like surface antigen
VGYEIPLPWLNDDEDEEIRWFDALTPQINVYILQQTDVEGSVKRFDDSDDVDADYKMNFESTRLMLDFELDIFTVRDFSFYGIGGLGIAWNSADYTATPHGMIPIASVDLPTNDSTGFAYEFGGGVDYAVDEGIDITLQYLWTRLNDVTISGDVNIFDEEIYHTNTDISNDIQSILLGVRLDI